MTINFDTTRSYLQEFNFARLFIEILGWSSPKGIKPIELKVEELGFKITPISQLAGVVVFEASADDGLLPNAKIRVEVHKEISKLYHENLLIFLDADPQLQKTIPALPNVAFSTKRAPQTSEVSEISEVSGVLVYVRTGEGNDALAWIDEQGDSVTESQYQILKTAECLPETPALPRRHDHHEIVRKGVEKIAEQEKITGGQLGRPSGARFRVYERLKNFVDQNQGTLFVTPDLLKAIDEIYRFPLREYAKDVLNRQLRTGISAQQLAELVVNLRADDRLCITEENVERQEPKIICSLGLA